MQNAIKAPKTNIIQQHQYAWILSVYAVNYNTGLLSLMHQHFIMLQLVKVLKDVHMFCGWKYSSEVQVPEIVLKNSAGVIVVVASSYPLWPRKARTHHFLITIMMNVWKYEVYAPTMSPDTMKARQSFIFRWCSGWVELEGKAEGGRGGVFFFPLNISPWFCQSVLIQPFCFQADSSTIPSEMLIWQLSAPASAFPSLRLRCIYLLEEIALSLPLHQSLCFLF